MRVVVLALVALLAACSPSPLDDFESKLARMLCQHEIACGFYDPGYESLCEQQRAALDGVDLPLDVTVHSDQSAAFLDAVQASLAAAPCLRSDVEDALSTMQAFATFPKVVAGNIAPGSPCTRSVECVQPAVCVAPVPVSCGQCLAETKAIGDACSSFECAPGGYCLNGVCTAPGESGAACEPFQCASGFYCIHGSSGWSCQPPAASGMACDPIYGGCADGLVCNAARSPSVCTPPAADGEACSQDSDCAPRLVCSTIAGHTCRAPAPLGGSCGNVADCMEPFGCVDGNCSAPKVIGDSCQLSADCSIGWCNPADAKCAATLALGATCDPNGSSLQCASGFCAQSRKCARCWE
jgi:hypothetical protein